MKRKHSSNFVFLARVEQAVLCCSKLIQPGAAARWAGLDAALAANPDVAACIIEPTGASWGRVPARDYATRVLKVYH